MTIIWDETLSINIYEIDKQHEKLISLVSDLHSAFMQNKHSGHLNKDILQSMLDFTKEHFLYEERYMEKICYPDILFHKVFHSRFLKKITIYKEKIQKRKLFLNRDMMIELMEWLQHHIKTEDKKITLFEWSQLKL